MRNIQPTKGMLHSLAVFVAVCGLLLLSGCRSPLEPQGETGTLSLTINGQGMERTILPDISLNDFVRFDLELYHRNTGNTVSDSWAGGTGTITLPLGIWDLQVTAFLPDGEAAVGVLNGIVVPSGGAVSGTVMLVPIAEGTGTFYWDLSFPDDTHVAWMEIRRVEWHGGWYTESSLDNFYFIRPQGWEYRSLYPKQGSLELNAGQYRVFFTMNDDQWQWVTVRETLHIYQNMASRFQESFDAQGSLLWFIMGAWDGSLWDFAGRGITAGHFPIVGINGVNNDNFYDVTRWLNVLGAEFGVPDHLSGLMRLVDTALIGIASEDAAFLNAGNYRHRGEAEVAIAEMVQNGTYISFSWADNRTVTVYIDYRYTVQFVFSADIGLPPVPQPGDSLADWLAWIRIFADHGETHNVVISGNESITPLQAALPTGRSNLTINLSGSGPSTVSLASNGSLFTVGSGITLVLGTNVTLQGMENNNRPLIMVDWNGTLIMNQGARITGNRNTGADCCCRSGGGVKVRGTFDMHGGEISGNACDSGFTSGGGVHNRGTFTMRGGVISGNVVRRGGGGVGNTGTFRISNGIIHGNDAAPGLANTTDERSGHALFDCCCGTSQFGTFNGDVFIPSGLFTFVDSTIEMVNGTLVRPVTAPVIVSFSANSATGLSPGPWTVVIGQMGWGFIRLPGPGTLQRSGYAFNGWNTAPDGSGVQIEEGTPIHVTGNVTLFAMWTPGLTVAFNANGASGHPPRSMSVTEPGGGTISLPGQDNLNKTGHSFDGWNTAPDGSGYHFYPWTSHFFVNSVALFAIWTPILHSNTGHLSQVFPDP